jgi:hypothetical protein
MVVDQSSISLWTIAEKGTLITPTQASGTHASFLGIVFLGGMISWHTSLGLET